MRKNKTGSNSLRGENTLEMKLKEGCATRFVEQVEQSLSETLAVRRIYIRVGKEDGQ